MTTYQDPPLQSRRAARQNERADAVQPQYPDALSTPLQPAPSAPITSLTTPESLLYSTQGRSVPDYDGPNFRGRRVAETPEDAATALRGRLPRTGLQPRGSTCRDAELVAADHLGRRPELPDAAAPSGSGRAGTRYRVVRSGAADAGTCAAAPAAPAYSGDVDGGALPEHTLTRRELRAIRESQGLPPEPESGPAYAAPASATSAVPPLVEPAPWPGPEQYVGPVQYATGPAVYETPATITSPSHYTDPPVPSATTSTNDQFSAFEALFGAEQQPATTAPEAEFPTQYAHPMPTVPPVYVAPVAAEPIVAEPVYEAPASEQPVYEARVSEQPVYEERASEQPVYEAPEVRNTGERPVGHWSRQAELDDETQFASGSISREVGIGVITTSALVLPEIPHHDFTRTLTSTGDVLRTGSIDLPRSLSSTGALPAQLDESDIDHLLDPGDRQVASTDSQPVRAVKAVSTHTSSRGIINATPPKRGNKMLTALIVSASAMLVVVVGLAVVIVMSGVLK